jgi:hypothetical protein
MNWEQVRTTLFNFFERPPQDVGLAFGSRNEMANVLYRAPYFPDIGVERRSCGPNHRHEQSIDQQCRTINVRAESFATAACTSCRSTKRNRCPHPERVWTEGRLCVVGRSQLGKRACGRCPVTICSTRYIHLLVDYG